MNEEKTRLLSVRLTLLAMFGAACMCAGLWMMWPPLALVSSGVYLLWLTGDVLKERKKRADGQ